MTFTPTDLSDEEAEAVRHKANLIAWEQTDGTLKCRRRREDDPTAELCMHNLVGEWHASKAFLWNVLVEIKPHDDVLIWMDENGNARYASVVDADNPATALLRAYIAEE